MVDPVDVSAAIAPEEPWLDLRDFEDTCYYVPWYRSQRFRDAVAWEVYGRRKCASFLVPLPEVPEAEPRCAPARLVTTKAGRTSPNPAACPEPER